MLNVIYAYYEEVSRRLICYLLYSKVPLLELLLEVLVSSLSLLPFLFEVRCICKKYSKKKDDAVTNAYGINLVIHRSNQFTNQLSKHLEH